MAAPRCARAFLSPLKRTKVSHPRTSLQTFSRARTSQSEDSSQETRPKRRGKGVTYEAWEQKDLQGRLEDLEIDPEEFQARWKSHEKGEEAFMKWEPKTAEEAKERWEEAKQTPDNLGLLHMYKRGGVYPLTLAEERNITLPTDKEPLDETTEKELAALRTPLNIQAINLRPLRRTPKHGIPVCDLQLRTYSIRNLLLFADFAVRAAYYMGLCARGPIPLPKITERWTVPRSNFIFKKSQENFERITMRRLIQIQDGHPEVVRQWLAFLSKHQFHGVGMKANIFEFENLDSALSVGAEIKDGESSKGRREAKVLEKVQEILGSRGYSDAMKGHKGPKELEQRA